MALTTDQVKQLEELLNKISSEVILAKSGCDDGLIPVYSLFNEMAETFEDCELLATSLQKPIEALDMLLDEFKPWDEKNIQLTNAFVSWLQKNLRVLSEGQDVDYFAEDSCSHDSKNPAAAPDTVGQTATTASVTAPNAPEPDVMLELNLEDDRELLTEFQTEAIEHLEAIEQAVLQLEADPKEPESMAALFRAYHTIKGVAGFLHLVPIQSLAHEVESLLDLARNDKLTLDGGMISIVLESRDVVQALVDQITVALEQGELPGTIIPVNGLIQRVQKEIERGLSGDQSAPAEATSTQPAEPAADVEKGFFDTNEVSEPANEPDSVYAKRLSAPAATVPNAVPLPESSNQKDFSASAIANTKQPLERSSIRVNTSKLDSLMDMVGELVIVQSQLQESSRNQSDSPLQRNLSQLLRITKDLQHTSMALRMVPIKPTFQKTARIVRDLSKTIGKKINFTMSGEDTELDRNVVEQIGDPLVHMIRNAIDHGLEESAERLKIGKSEAGNIDLSAYHQGSNIIVQLKDDGRGIDCEKILAKAINKGLADADTQYSNDEIYQFLFMPGFSTADKITEISGRGVGMDVVKKNIEKLRGTVEIASKIGEGSTFKIVLPLTMAIIDGLVVRVGTDKFILPTTSVKIAIRPEAKQITKIQGRAEVLDLRNKTVPITRLHRRFNIHTEVTNLTEGIIVIVESFGKPYGLLVDEMISKQEVVIKSLGSMMQGLPGVAGGAILGDGTIALILDPASLFGNQNVTLLS